MSAIITILKYIGIVLGLAGCAVFVSLLLVALLAALDPNLGKHPDDQDYR